jgi:glycosyltransferase involved in cell wall biosynthesis
MKSKNTSLVNKLMFSVITPSYNQGQYIEDTILSVADQEYDNFEHIIIDGGSTDNTIEILKKYKHLKWISEKDKGQSHAINKGLRMSSGDILCWLNSDDFYEKDALLNVAEYFTTNKECVFLYGDITYVNEKKEFLYKETGGSVNYHSLLKNPDLIRQPSSFWRRSIVDEIGYINEDLHYVMDLDYFLRISSKYKMEYIPVNISYFRQYNENKTISNKRKQVVEIFKTLLRNSSYIPMSTKWILFKRYFGSFAAFRKIYTQYG